MEALGGSKPALRGTMLAQCGAMPPHFATNAKDVSEIFARLPLAEINTAAVNLKFAMGRRVL